MSVEIQPNSPLGEALNLAIQGKIADLGWASGGAEGSAMSEYFILMLANGKSQAEIATEITNDLLNLTPEDEWVGCGLRESRGGGLKKVERID